jgi:hypothetical protein
MAIQIDNQNIISLLGIESLPDEEKVMIVEKVTTLVEKRVLVRIFDGLDEARQNKFSGLLEKEDQAGTQQFIEQNIPNMEELMETEINLVKQELSEWLQSLA